MKTRDEFKEAIKNFTEFLDLTDAIVSCDTCSDWHNINDVPFVCQTAELLDLTDAIISCDICGDCHNINEVPFVCQTGDGV